MLKTLVSLTLTYLALAPAALAAPDLAGDWVMHIYVGNRLFEDRVHVERDAQGAYTGTVTVPDRFTSPLEKVTVTADVASFEIVGHERGEAFRVKYDGRWDAQGTIFVGIATLPEEKGDLLGGFVAQRAPHKP
ncbi:MAG: hypothetical protein JWM80_3030 [Cyanobacteria bacterium RYN_339]|nr:hypothetical protein [Cyanobacteria bacterium RYN_339]